MRSLFRRVPSNTRLRPIPPFEGISEEYRSCGLRQVERALPLADGVHQPLLQHILAGVGRQLDVVGARHDGRQVAIRCSGADARVVLQVPGGYEQLSNAAAGLRIGQPARIGVHSLDQWPLLLVATVCRVASSVCIQIGSFFLNSSLGLPLQISTLHWA